ncbi:MAG: NAD(P)/FAD-dependent oxidoreductase [Ruminococcus sp.]|nr:NAD(P)/FAD-dependent oxidoreductase [Ruminococcus sp.]
MFDVLIIGAGASGCAVARELSRFRLSLCVLDRESDVCEGTTKANSAIVHAGFDALPGSLKAKLNVRGSRMMPELAKKLDFAFKNNGAFVLCFDKEQIPGLEELAQRGRLNGVEGVRVISGDEARQMEPALTDEVAAALYAPTSGIVCPFEMTLAFAENAYANGAEFRLSTCVTGIDKSDAGYVVHTDKGDIEAKVVINAAGVYADRLHAMVSSKPMNITPRRGEYMLLDKDAGGLVKHTIFQQPTKMGKGILVSPTVHGNLLLGPTAEDIEDKENTATTRSGLAEVRAKAQLSVKGIPFNKVITGFTGLRAVGDTHDFIIGECEDAKGFIDVAGIESPGLTSAPAIGEYVRDIVAGIMTLEEKPDFVDTRKGVIHFASLTREQQNELIKREPAYGSVVCRCETVTEGEILDAINRPLGATTLDGVKRRTRAGMGRCQAGFCSPKTIAMIAEKLGIGLLDVKKNGTYNKESEAADNA